ncbi:hypothetical protein QOT17_002245 [Balamuthia mandrillaris]
MVEEPRKKWRMGFMMRGMLRVQNATHSQHILYLQEELLFLGAKSHTLNNRGPQHVIRSTRGRKLQSQQGRKRDPAMLLLLCLLMLASQVAVLNAQGGAPMPENYRLEDEPFILQTSNAQIRMRSQPSPSPNFLLLPISPNSGQVLEQYWVHFQVWRTTVPDLGLIRTRNDYLISHLYSPEVALTSFPPNHKTEELEQWSFMTLNGDSRAYVNHTVTKTNVTFQFGDREVSYPSDTFKFTVGSANMTVFPVDQDLLYLEQYKLISSHPVTNGTASHGYLPNYQEVFDVETAFFKFSYTALNFSLSDGEISAVDLSTPWEPILNEKNETTGFIITSQFSVAQDIIYDPSLSILVTGDGPEEEEEERDDDWETTRILIAVFVSLSVVLVLLTIVGTVFFLRMRAKRKINQEESVNY